VAQRTRKPTRADQARAQIDEARARIYHDLVLESAEQLFGAKGFEEATMREVAQEAGISLKTLYATFPGKQDLYREIQSLRGRAFLERVGAAVEQGSDPLDRLARATRAYVDFLLEHPNWLRIHLHERVSWGLGPATGEGTELWRAGVDNLAGIVRDGVAEGSFHPGDPDAMAMMGIAIMQVHLSRALELGEKDAERLANEVLLHLRRLLCRSEGARPSSLAETR
jgi:AcrR family transcriptional regulator